MNTFNVRPVILALAGAVALTACGDRPITDLSQEENRRPVLRTVVAPGAILLPNGAVATDDIFVAGFDFSVTDAFDRAVAPSEDYVERAGSCCPGLSFDVAGGFRNSSQDPRLPALVESDATVGGWYAMWNPSLVAEGLWNLWGEIEGLNPESDYTIVLARMALTVNGELDQNQILTGQEVDEPDELGFLGGTPAGGSGVPKADFPAVSPAITGDMNPVAVCWDEGADVDFDCIPQFAASSPVWKQTGATTPVLDSLPFGSNTPGSRVEPGQYNYILVYEGRTTDANPIPPGNPTVRIQVGPDIDANGNAINNGFRPLPTGAVGNPAELPGGANAFPAPATLTMDGDGFPAGPTYEIMLYDRASGTFAPAEADVIVSDIVILDPIEGTVDTLSSDTTRAGTFTTPVGTATVALAFDLEGAPLDAASHVVIRMQGEDDSEFLYKEFLTEDLAIAEDGPAIFGQFDPGGTNTEYMPAGSGEAEFFGDSLLVRLKRLPTRLPDGFHYQSYLVTLDGSTVTGTQRLHAVELDAIGNGADRIAESEAEGGFGAYNFWTLVLEPNTAQGLTEMQIQATEDYFGKFSEFFNR